MIAAWTSLLAALIAGSGEIETTTAPTEGPPWVEATLTIDTDLDPPSYGGLASVSAEVLRDHVDAIADAAGTADMAVRHGTVVLSFGVPASRREAVLDELAERLRSTSPTDAAVEIARARAQARHQAEAIDERALARRAMRAALYDQPPLSQAPSGASASLAAVTRAEVAQWLRRTVVRSRLHLHLAGDVPAQVRWLAPDLPQGAASPRRAASWLPKHRRIVVVDKPGAHRAVVAVGRAPIVRPMPSCRDDIRAEAWLHDRAVWWRRARPSEVERAARGVMAHASSTPDEACREDLAALGRAPAHPIAPPSADAAMVVVVVTEMKAGLPQRLSEQLFISDVVVLPYDRL